MQEHHPDLGVEVLAYRANQVRHDLGERFGPGQGGTHRIETLEVETLLFEFGLLTERRDGLFLELEADQGGGGGDDCDDHDRRQDVTEDVGLSLELDEGDGEADDHCDQGVGPPHQQEAGDRRDSIEHRLRRVDQLGDAGDCGDSGDQAQEPARGGPGGRLRPHHPVPPDGGGERQQCRQPCHGNVELWLGEQLCPVVARAGANCLIADEYQDEPGNSRGAAE
jgi:hypothetical protein